MALSNILVFNREQYKLSTEILQDQINLFNAATRGGILLRAASLAENQGSFHTETFWKKQTTVRRRNAFSTAAISSLNMTMDSMASVKVAAGTPKLVYTPGDMQWIGQVTEAERFAMATQAAEERFADMLSAALKSAFAAISATASNFLDISGTPGTDAARFNAQTALDASFKLGDGASRLRCWVANSLSYQQFMNFGMTNTAKLFNWANVAVTEDAQGRPIIVSDIVPIISGSPNKYQVLGLTEGGVIIDSNDDYADEVSPELGYEQIRYNYQAQWTYNLRLKGYTWDVTNGGASPTDAALATATNWDVKATDKRDLAGVVLRTGAS